MKGVLASPNTNLFLSFKQHKTVTHYSITSRDSRVSCSPISDLKTPLVLRTGGCRRPKNPVRCNSSTGPGSPGSGENESRAVLDAFFLGKALAEALNERIESTVGEFLSTVGRLQAEQQKQIQEFQEDVLDRAKKAKERAAREAMEAQGLIPKPTTVGATPVTNGAPQPNGPSSTTTSSYSSSNQIATTSVKGSNLGASTADE